jgi:two-component system, NtrC family, sensor kinase
MRRRSRAGGKPTETRRLKAVTLKRGNAPKAVRRRSPSAAGLQEQLDRRTQELTEALAQQTATADVLKVISRSTFDLNAVWRTLVESACTLCDAPQGLIELLDGDVYRLVMQKGYGEAFERYLVENPLRAGSPSGTGRAAGTGVVSHIPDVLQDPDYRLTEGQRLGGYRANLAVPLLREQKVIGVFVLARPTPGPFTPRQIALVQTFADQAVIAVENVRLFDDVQKRTAELTEALDQQTATSEVLQIVSKSPGDLQPVFEGMLANATRICNAKFGVLFLSEGNGFRSVALHGAPPDYAEARRREPVVRVNPGTALGRVAATKQTVQIADIRTEPAYTSDLERSAILELAGARTLVVVPMLKNDEVVGQFAIYRQEVRPFTDKQIDLVKNFASQAVIAIENTRLLNELRERTDDLSESLEQQTATSEVLGVISRSKFELQPILQSVVDTAARLCRAEQAVIFRLENGIYRFAAGYGVNPAYLEIERQTLISPGEGTVVGRAAVNRRVVRIDDAWADPLYEKKQDVRIAGARSMIGVPLMREGEPIGVIALARNRVEPFAEREIELVTTFADQAVIAIENVRLFEAEQRRTRELTESLEQQTATANVLRVIASSPTDIEPVLEAIVRTAGELCASDYAILFRLRDGQYHMAWSNNADPEWVKYWSEHPISVDRGSLVGRTVLERRSVHILDCLADPEYVKHEAARLGRQRTMLGVPLLRDDTPIGVIVLLRSAVRAFTEKQIELVTTFASQAVIAIENTRLLNELRQRTADLTESLEQQTATANVLEVISRSAFDLQAVFETVAESSVRLCAADRAFIFRFDGALLRMASAFNAPPEFKAWVEQNPIRPGRHSGSARAALERKTIHIPDIFADPEYTFGARDIETVRTILAVPILKGDELLGVIMVYRLEMKAFTDQQIALVETFADQAAIAIENVRLLDALRHRTDDLGRSVEELRALGEVSQAVNSTLDLETVLFTIVANAVKLSGTEAGAIYVYDDRQREFHLRATYGMDRELIGALTRQHIGLEEPNVAVVFAQREAVQTADLKEEAVSDLNEITLRAGFRARLVAPLLRGEDLVGMLVVRRRTPGAFPPNTVDLIKTFAAQSAVAIENARLFQNVEASLEDLRTAQDRLVQTQKLASLGQLTAGIAHEIKNPLNFVNNFSGVSAELLDELRDAVGRMKGDAKTHAEIIELTDTLHDNLDKIVQHGKRADSIVKNMLLHSREGSGERRAVDINALVEEAVNLAYHGARAERQGFNITLERSFDPAAGKADLFPQEITRVLLNLISNGFYAATNRKGQANSDGYEPTLTAATKNLGDRVEIRIRDNGTGIPPEVKEKMFNPFFTTKPAGEGTGLGLSISHDIIVKQHAGRIEVDTRPGEFTEFRVVLPRAAASQTKRGGQA